MAGATGVLTRLDIVSVQRKLQEGLPPEASHCFAVATSTTSAATAIPAELQNTRSEWLAEADIHLVFGTSNAVTADRTATSGATVTWLLKSGVVQSFMIPLVDGLTHFATQAASGTPILRFRKASH